MAPEDGGAPPSRKVRSACRRCRTKRVKCDGSIPACTNCARAKVPCIDVHTGNNDLSIPRDFAVRCCSRIKWLERQVKALSPDFDFSQGPQVNMDFLESFGTAQDNPQPETVLTGPISTAEYLVRGSNQDEPVANKRSHSIMESEAGSPLSAKARSVAIDLGMLSLQSDSRQRHYLGSSSGLLFTKLLGLDSEPSPAQASFQARPLAPRRIPDGIYRSLYDQLQKELPSPEDACVLLEVYFQNIHIDQPFLHPASLLNAYKALYKCAQHGYNGSVDQSGWSDIISPFPYNARFDVVHGQETTPISIFTAVFHVFMSFSLAATVLTRKKNYDYSPTRFHRTALSAASETFSNISLTSLQGTLLLAVQALVEPASVNVWTLTHIAMSHCIDLGLHREPRDTESSKATTTILRFVFYTVYSLDRSISTIQGRPLGIRDETFDIRPPDNADIPEMAGIPDHDTTIQLPSSEFLALSILRFHLDRQVSEIKLLLYHLPTRNQSFVWPTDYVEIQRRINAELDQWLVQVQEISASEFTDDDEKTKLRFEKMRHEQLYHSAITLLFQPSQMFPSPSQNALSICYQSCSRRLQIYDIVSTKDMLYYNWRNIHGIFSSGSTIVYCAWVSRDLQRTIPFAKLLRDLRICSNHLSIGSQWWPSVRSGKESFEMMIDLIIKYFSELQLQDNALPPHRRLRIGIEKDISEGRDTPSHHTCNTQNSGPPLSMTQNIYYEQVPTQTPNFEGRNMSFMTEDPVQSSFDPAFDLSIPSECMHEFHTPSIETAMENFMAEHLHEDWGWDPFSSSTDQFDNIGPG